MPTIAGIKLLTKDIATLSNGLPQSIPQGTKADKIWNVMKVDERDTAFETFNMRFDAMFGEDCRDSGGRLHHISRGRFGIGCVCSYLAKVDWSNGFPLDLVEIKLQRLLTELRHIWCVAGLDLLYTMADIPLVDRKQTLLAKPDHPATSRRPQS